MTARIKTRSKVLILFFIVWSLVAGFIFVNLAHADNSASSYLWIERNPIPIINDVCRERAVIKNRHINLAISAYILETQHLFSGNWKSGLIVTLFPGEKADLGCSWYKGAIIRTDYKIISAWYWYEVRPIPEDSEIESTCVPEGESYPITPEHYECCEGLVPVSCSEPDKNGDCKLCLGASFCTNCGDGKCGPGENVCRCPEDCEVSSFLLIDELLSQSP